MGDTAAITAAYQGTWQYQNQEQQKRLADSVKAPGVNNGPGASLAGAAITNTQGVKTGGIMAQRQRSMAQTKTSASAGAAASVGGAAPPMSSGKTALGT